MSNSYFQFKQFRVEQGRCAMKVSTDACIQGAWTPVLSEVRQVLDIGAGTGLLSLMLAQRNSNIKIDAIELEENTCHQAQENFNASPWAERLNVIHGDVKEHRFVKKYDLIISNPPFFQNDLKGDNHNRNLARHNLSFSLSDLFNVIRDNLTTTGYASVLLPYSENILWEKLLFDNGWWVFNKLVVYPKAEKQPNRVISLCGNNRCQVNVEQLIIYSNKNYTEEFVDLLSPFYLNL